MTVTRLLPLVFLASTLEAQARWKLTETLRIGGADSGVASFVWAKSFDADARGRIWIYEHSSQDIRVFGSDGKFIKTVGRRGSGPGELRNAEGLVFGRDGRLWVRDHANTRLSVFDAEGQYLRAWTLRLCTSQGAWTPHVDAKGRIVDQDCVIGTGPPPDYAALAYRADMSGIDTLAYLPRCGDRSLFQSATWTVRTGRGTRYSTIPWSPRPQSALSIEGDLWCAPNSARYEVLRLAASGTDTVRVSRSLRLFEVSRAERDSVIASYGPEERIGLDFSKLPSVKPAIDRLTVDDQDRLWVRRAAANSLIEFDIFDRTGRHLAVVELGQPYRMSVYMPFVVRGESLYTVIVTEDGVPQVARFRIGR